MSIADKLLVIAENVPKVYEAGQKAGGGGCNVDHNALRQEGYNEGYTKGKTDGETVGYNKGYADGQNDAPNMLEYAHAARFPSCNVFGKEEMEINFGEELSDLQSFISVQSNSAEYRVNKILKHITINSSGFPENMQSFMGCSYSYRDEVLKKITLNVSTQKVVNFSNAFNCLVALEEIDGIPLDLSSATTVVNVFNYNNNLKEVRFKEETIYLSIKFNASTVLSATSMQSIIAGLATVETAQTLTLHSKQNVLQSHIDTANAKGWTVVGGTVVQEAW